MVIQFCSTGINKEFLTEFFSNLSNIYSTDKTTSEKTNKVVDSVKANGYLPMSHIEALENLSPIEIIAGIKEKLKINNVFDGEKFNYTYLSPVKRTGYNDSSWIKKEQLSVKLLNLCALGNGNKTDKVAGFFDILTQILILPSGDLQNGILNTTIYLTPFHPREFGCAYLPKSADVTPALCDENIKKDFGYDAKTQVQILLAIAQLCGHPLMYDVLPQTARYSKAVLSAPHIARWFDIKHLIKLIDAQINKLDASDKMKSILKEYLIGNYVEIDNKLKRDYENALEDLLEFKKNISENMMQREQQDSLHKRAKSIILKVLKKPEDAVLTQNDITNQTDIISALINEGLWPAPGGAWNSCGTPVFDMMCKGAGYPLFRHFNIDKEDVTKFANLDCQTPYYFFNFDKKTYNEDVIDFYIKSLESLQQDYNFDGFRVDHIDHIVDRVSQKDGLPISYRAPFKVLAKANATMKAKIPYFATLAEYMLWDGFLKEYHQDMHFDLLWGNDIISQGDKKIKRIFEDLKQLEEYNNSLTDKSNKLSILKIYNNQDGEFSAIDQYPGQLGEAGALLKYMKYKTIVGGEFASRPVMYVDGDESFTKEGTEYAIGNETSLKRENHNEFFKKFTAIENFAKTCRFCKFGKSYLLRSDEDGFCAWVNVWNDYHEQVLFIVNEQYPTEKLRISDADGNLTIKNVIGKEIFNKTLELGNNNLMSEFFYNDGKFTETPINADNQIHFNSLKPSEFHIYRITRR